MVRQWNIVFRCETKIDEYRKLIERSEEQQSELDAMIADINQQLEDTAGDDTVRQNHFFPRDWKKPKKLKGNYSLRKTN